MLIDTCSQENLRGDEMELSVIGGFDDLVI